jgi:uncharacterized RDD family membrane protein YckC
MAAITVLNKGNVPTGPFTRAQLAEKLRSGEFSLSDLAFVEGLSQWTPLRDVLARVDVTEMPLPPPVTAPPVPAPVSPPSAYSYAATMQPPSHLVFAGFWVRFAAYLIDAVILSVPIGILGVIVGVVMVAAGAASGFTHSMQNFNSDSPANAAFPIAIVLFELVIGAGFAVLGWLYFALLESGPHQGTYGKQIMNLKVTGMTGERVSIGRASGRFFSKIITGMVPFAMGYIMMVFMDKKQALHDLIASTLVVKS